MRWIYYCIIVDTGVELAKVTSIAFLLNLFPWLVLSGINHNSFDDLTMEDETILVTLQEAYGKSLATTAKAQDIISESLPVTGGKSLNGTDFPDVYLRTNA